MATQKFSSFSSLPNNNILQPKRLNNTNNINAGSSPSLTDPALNRRILGQKGQLPSLSSNGISHLSNQQLTTLLRSSPIIDASLSSCSPNGLNGSMTTTSMECSPCVISTSTGTKRAPNTMAKRNARERNRVKQVNQGFQTLRQHIPDSYRMKKMSKVDTLRCALDYIRNLERILQLPEDQGRHSPLSILTSSSISPSTSLIFSSEEDELFLQPESPSSSFHHHQHQLNQSLLSANTPLDKNLGCRNVAEMDEPAFESGLLTSGQKIILVSSMDPSSGHRLSSRAYNNEENRDENSNQENQNLGIKNEPCSPSEGLPSAEEEQYRIDVIGVSVGNNNNGITTEPILGVDMDMGIISPCDGQSQGQLSDGHSDIENFHDDSSKFQFS